VTVDFNNLVTEHYQSLYRFALSLSRKESDACDLTQQTFYVWAAKGHQLQDGTKAKTWLFTTLYRQFLEGQRRQTRFPHYELEEVTDELPQLSPELVDHLDAVTAVDLLDQIEPVYRAPVALFYLEEHSYKEIAEILEVPIGTVKSRIARGIGRLQSLLTSRATLNQ
jgi:RNA polymerase sigma factor (sigma-70 family)